jgi:hypothetical protein
MCERKCDATDDGKIGRFKREMMAWLGVSW